MIPLNENKFVYTGIPVSAPAPISTPPAYFNHVPVCIVIHCFILTSQFNSLSILIH